MPNIFHISLAKIQSKRICLPVLGTLHKLQISRLEKFHEKIQKSIEASTNEEKHVQAESEADQSKEKENLLHTSAEGIAPTEIILETSESVKKPESSEAEDTGEIIKKEAEITDTEIEKSTTKSK